MSDNIFDDHYRNNYWGDPDSISGPGSNLKETEAIRAILPTLFTHMGITSILDLPCGDLHWFWQMWLESRRYYHYIGADIVPELIAENRKKFVYPDMEFQVLDARTDELPKVDLILCRDMFVHLSFADSFLAAKNFRASGSKWLLATTFPGADDKDITTGMWRPVDMARFRYGLGEPGFSILDGNWGNKSLALWRLNE